MSNRALSEHGSVEQATHLLIVALAHRTCHHSIHPPLLAGYGIGDPGRINERHDVLHELCPQHPVAGHDVNSVLITQVRAC